MPMIAMTAEEQVALSLKKVRRDYGLSTKMISDRAKQHGVPWHSSTVANIEKAEAALSLSAIFTLLRVLSELTGRNFMITDLLNESRHLRLHRRSESSLHIEEVYRHIDGRGAASTKSIYDPVEQRVAHGLKISAEDLRSHSVSCFGDFLHIHMETVCPTGISPHTFEQMLNAQVSVLVSHINSPQRQRDFAELKQLLDSADISI